MPGATQIDCRLVNSSLRPSLKVGASPSQDALWVALHEWRDPGLGDIGPSLPHASERREPGRSD